MNAHRSSTSNIKTDTFPNCESRFNKMGKRDRPNSANKPCSRKCSKNPISPNNGVLVPTISSTLKPKSGNVRQQNLPLPKPGNVCKEIPTDDSALVEVTVRRHTSKKGNKEHKSDSRQPWDKLLKTKKGVERVSSFSNFDPLRTLHFLAEELQSKLKKDGFGDSHMKRIIEDMQQALTRIPADVTSTVNFEEMSDYSLTKQLTNEIRTKAKKKTSLNKDLETAVSKFPERTSQKASLHFDFENVLLNGFSTENSKASTYEMELPEKLFPVFKSNTTNKYSQIDNGIVAESEMYQKQLAMGTQQLEKSSKDMKLLCTQLKNDKEELEMSLLAEKDTVKLLQRRIDEMKTRLTDTADHKIKQFREENIKLNAQIKELQSQLKSEQGLPFHELKSLVQQMQIEKANIEQENMSLKHQLTISKMEKEKYIAILNVRDRQINDIRMEMTQLQEVVNEQLSELQKASFASSPSSQSIMIGNLIGASWQPTSVNAKVDKIGDNLSLSSFNSESPINEKYNKDLQMLHVFREAPSGDGTTSMSNIELFASKMKKNESEIRMLDSKGTSSTEM